MSGEGVIVGPTLLLRVASIASAAPVAACVVAAVAAAAAVVKGSSNVHSEALERLQNALSKWLHSTLSMVP